MVSRATDAKGHKLIGLHDCRLGRAGSLSTASALRVGMHFMAVLLRFANATPSLVLGILVPLPFINFLGSVGMIRVSQSSLSGD